MAIVRLTIDNVRIIAHADLEPSRYLNIITGANGSGKTSLLEGIHLLGLGRSFRTQDIGKVIRDGAAELTVFGRLDDGSGHSLGVRRSRRETAVRIDGEPVRRLATLAEHLPLLVVTPQSHRLLEAGRGHRREYIDWGVFHVEHEFLDHWQRYKKALRQRNTLLKQSPGSRSLAVWNRALAEAGEAVTALRQEYLESLAPYAAEYAGRLVEVGDFELQFRRGWPADTDLHQALDEAQTADRQRGFTTLGPQRAELRLRGAGRDLLDRVSRGQQKLLVYALKLAQIHHLRDQTGKRSVLLLDDLGAELDREHQARLLQLVVEQQSQVFLTATSIQDLAIDTGPMVRLFHVEQGRVEPVPHA